MKYTKFRNIYRALIFSIIFALSATATLAQTNEITYQGSLKDGANPANGNYDLQFELHAASTGGAPIGTRIRLNVPVTNGVFTVKLDFAAAVFNGADRYLEIGVKPAGSPGGYQQLLPRQPITFAPYSFRSLNATNADTATRAEDSLQLGGIAANQYVLTGDSRLSDARNPLAGSDSYIQSRLTQQPGIINFNISGNGTLGGTLSANTLSATGAISTFTQYNIAGNRVLSVAGTDNLFVGWGAGMNNTGQGNSFFGSNAGNANDVGDNNAFFGTNAGVVNTNGSRNSFFGLRAGFSNTSANDNSFFGRSAGSDNITGQRNSFFGGFAGSTNTVGDDNTIIGTLADVGSNNLNFATAIGAGAVVANSNTIQLGRGNTLDTVLIPGKLQIDTLATSGSTSLCINGSNRIAGCSSSLRYKTNVQNFTGGLNIVKRLRPITFNWREGGMFDVGFAAEEVEQIEPLLATYNKDGQIEGVKYGQITTVLVNAIKEQQMQIEGFQNQIRQQQQQIDALKKLVCSQNPNAEICKEQQ